MGMPLDRAFFAEDAYDHWAKRISAASESIWVLTPQTDETLLALLHDTLAPEVVVLTSIRPEVVGLGYRDHLLGLRALLENQIDVRISIRPLSANVLVCDSELVSTGSQRFNAAGRTENAVTLGPANSIQGSDFAATLQSWLSAGEGLDLSLVEALLEKLDRHLDAVETAQRELVDEFEFAIADRVLDLFADLDWSIDLAPLGGPEVGPAATSGTGAAGLMPVAHGLQTTLSNSRRASEKRVLVQLRTVGQDWDPYLSLVADGDVDMTLWEQPLDDGSTQRVLLERLDMYPMILNPSGRMGFARVGKTRITYVRQAVHWTAPVRIGESLYDLEVSFPEDDFDKSNMHLTLRPVDRSSGSVMLKLRFDGMVGLMQEAVALQNGHPGELSHSDESNQLIDELLHDPTVLDDLLSEALRPFRYKTLGRERRNAETFFPRGVHRVRLFRYGMRSVLAVSQAHVR